MPARYAAPRHLTEQQLKNPLIRTAYHRLGNIVSYRGQYLRRLDGVHGDRRTRLEKFTAIERVAEQVLVRLDLATGVLGYIDPQNGRYVLNTQRGIAEDAGISAPALCRLLKTLDDAGYVYRRIERVRLDGKDENGLHLVRTRVLVRFTKLFWKDLGLAYVFERVQKAAKKRRAVTLEKIGQQRLSELEQHSLELQRRERSRQRWQAKEAREAGGDTAGGQAQPQARENAPSRPGNALQSALEKLMASVANKTK
ncbi:MarR family transcriptional regulator [Pseudomonas sp. DC3000-4b1]|uniref:MarR family transcriptional regulator n=1 Tax=unclassified Pseudomonas TaxID=196821 RepID=UPI003CE81FC9